MVIQKIQADRSWLGRFWVAMRKDVFFYNQNMKMLQNFNLQLKSDDD